MRRFVLLFLLLGLFACAAVAQPTIFIVRHAEKTASIGRDPDLSEAGRVRAASLAKILKDAGITAICVTDLKRTQQTAAPLSRALGIEPTILPANDIAALSAQLRNIRRGNVLVVGSFRHCSKADQSIGHRHIDQDRAGGLRQSFRRYAR